jgi:hypothetical protein
MYLVSIHIQNAYSDLHRQHDRFKVMVQNNEHLVNPNTSYIQQQGDTACGLIPCYC